MLRLSLLPVWQLRFVEVKANLFYNFFFTKLVRKYIDVNEHERLSSITLRQTLK